MKKTTIFRSYNPFARNSKIAIISWYQKRMTYVSIETSLNQRLDALHHDPLAGTHPLRACHTWAARKRAGAEGT
jgi:hypothetical protein